MICQNSAMGSEPRENSHFALHRQQDVEAVLTSNGQHSLKLLSVSFSGSFGFQERAFAFKGTLLNHSDTGMIGTNRTNFLLRIDINNGSNFKLIPDHLPFL